ncbi:cg30 [Artaxa digramma nucleopolyhedrovirus]|uniref:Cg30 n=1 Tax=Artaxa digramma nucleopolyhedrovirus TaxID=3070910 RepID=A0AAE6R7J1_9ABAC|nr:cg30 [Euproctis digramma nucleopolyhedrovirus]QHB21738.1 cg30 [Artaxa digramma nucleopolyhedrovirus]
MDTITLSCCVCLTNSTIVYNNNDDNYLNVMPLASLQCKHSFCVSCINLIKTKFCVKCPLCRHQSYKIIMYSVNRNMVNVFQIEPAHIKSVLKKNGNVDVIDFAKNIYLNNLAHDYKDDEEKKYLIDNDSRDAAIAIGANAYNLRRRPITCSNAKTQKIVQKQSVQIMKHIKWQLNKLLKENAEQANLNKLLLHKTNELTRKLNQITKIYNNYVGDVKF